MHLCPAKSAIIALIIKISKQENRLFQAVTGCFAAFAVNL